MSLSARRAWIEIVGSRAAQVDYLTSLSARRAWIEILSRDVDGAYLVGSLSARRAWIEITLLVYLALIRYVALRKESVDRNRPLIINRPSVDVALRKESVDRNYCRCYPCNTRYCVALRKESVDRNKWIKNKYPGCRLSLSARRAWIEIA